MVDFWGVVLGAATALAGSIASKWWVEARQRHALRAAFGAEIEALLKITETRKHETRAEEWLAKWRSGEDFVPKLFALDDDKMYEDPVYKNNVDKIGMLGPDAADTVLFYMNMTALRINLRVFVTGQVKDFTIEQRIAWVEGALAIWRPTKALGGFLVGRLRRGHGPRLGEPRTVPLQQGLEPMTNGSPSFKEQHLIETYKSLVPIASGTLRTVMLLNGGAAVALLAFLGSVAGRGPIAPPHVDMRWPMGIFLVGVFLAGLAHIGAYLTQLALYNESLGQVPRWRRHFPWLWGTVLIVALSLIAFIAGAMTAVLRFTT